MHIEDAKVVEHAVLTGDYRLLVLESAKIADAARPGQFVHLRVPRQELLVLRRPFGIFKADNGMLSLLYKRVGAGTSAMQSITPGDLVSIMGPLGNGFPTDSAGAFPVLVAGGYGIAALYLLAKELPSRGVIFTGGKTAEDILCTDDFAALGWTVRIATEDGSLGRKGLVTDILEDWSGKEGAGKAAEFYACGPDGMLEAVCRLAMAQGRKAWLSMDRHMGCGVGACLACVHRVKDSDGVVRWARVCRDGPVFECRQIVWKG